MGPRFSLKGEVADCGAEIGEDRALRHPCSYKIAVLTFINNFDRRNSAASRREYWAVNPERAKSATERENPRASEIS
jgi:hypothetical protein